MNVTSIEKQIIALNALVEGNSIRSTERMTGLHRDTIMRLLVRAGDKCQEIMDTHLRGVYCKRMQIDEIFTYVFKKEKRLSAKERLQGEYGDQYLFVALDPDTKLVPTFTIGKRNLETTMVFMESLHEKLKGNGRIQLSSDGFTSYVRAVEETFGADIDYGQQIKTFASSPSSSTGMRGYAPPELVECVFQIINGKPDIKHISTSFIERQNLTIRMQIRRFTRLTNAFSKKLENLKAAVSLHFAHYNFMRIHSTLKVTPAMEAKITDHIWGWKELLSYV